MGVQDRDWYKREPDKSPRRQAPRIQARGRVWWPWVMFAFVAGIWVMRWLIAHGYAVVLRVA